LTSEILTFEEGLEKLEQLIAGLEKGDLTLEESLLKFREGMELTRHCRKLLIDAEYRVEMILKNGETGEVKLQD
jgi:exodeoxyribonuclease VII small subunit